MAIRSDAFGRVTLTDRDADKFKKQVSFGKPKATAVANVREGVRMSREFRDNGGRLTLTLKRER